MIFSRREARRGERLRNSARVRASVKEESEMGSGGSGFFVSDDKYISKRTRNGLERCATTTGDWPICETHATRVATHLLPCARSIITTLLRIMYRPSQRRDTEPCCSFFFFFFFFFLWTIELLSRDKEKTEYCLYAFTNDTLKKVNIKYSQADACNIAVVFRSIPRKERLRRTAWSLQSTLQFSFTYL